ncbi:hypothetical protein O3M35_005903 [Rhynocoris fuscipes]|uniref:Uncharacterized protein n=1 Tax=Rhynocoris fuscipes TaxID=488301 RepID=A0AAW1DNM7_9HEMI
MKTSLFLILLVGTALASPFPRDIDEVQPVKDVAEENQRVKRDKNNEISVHISRGGGGGTQGTITYSRKFRRDVDDLAQEVEANEDVQVDGNERVKRGYNNEIGVHLSRGSRGGTQGMITYSRRFRRDADDLAQEVEAPEEIQVDGNERVKRDKNNEIGVHISRGSSGGTQGTITYSRRFRRDADDHEQEVEAPEVMIGENQRVKRDKNNEIGVHLSRGSSGGTQGMITFSHRFRRDADDLAQEVEAPEVMVGENQRVKRGYNNEIGVHLSRGSRGGTQGMITYSRRFRRDADDLAQEVEAPQVMVGENQRVKRGYNNEIGVHLSRGSSGGTQGMITYSRRFRRDADDLAQEVEAPQVMVGENQRVKRGYNNEIGVHLSRGSSGGTQGMITYSRRFRR